MNKEIIEQLKETKDIGELKEVAAKHGYPLNDEEANRYFELFHKSGKLADDELSSVSGGGCGSLSRNGSLYSSDPPHHLITTVGNGCNLYDSDPNLGIGRNCFGCTHSYSKFPALYCEARTYDKDEFNPKE